jgi:hypothetical protein
VHYIPSHQHVTNPHTHNTNLTDMSKSMTPLLLPSFWNAVNRSALDGLLDDEQSSIGSALLLAELDLGILAHVHETHAASLALVLDQGIAGRGTMVAQLHNRVLLDVTIELDGDPAAFAILVLLAVARADGKVNRVRAFLAELDLVSVGLELDRLVGHVDAVVELEAFARAHLFALLRVELGADKGNMRGVATMVAVLAVVAVVAILAARTALTTRAALAALSMLTVLAVLAVTTMLTVLALGTARATLAVTSVLTVLAALTLGTARATLAMTSVFATRATRAARAALALGSARAAMSAGSLAAVLATRATRTTRAALAAVSAISLGSARATGAARAAMSTRSLASVLAARAALSTLAVASIATVTAALAVVSARTTLPLLAGAARHLKLCELKLRLINQTRLTF